MKDLTIDASKPLYALAKAARPQPTFPDGNRERDGADDWGTERQIEAENAFFEYATTVLGINIDDLQTAKASSEEMIDEVLRRAELQWSGEHL